MENLTAALRKFKTRIKAHSGRDAEKLTFVHDEIKAGNFRSAKSAIDGYYLDTYLRDQIGSELIEIVRREGK